MDNKRIYVSGTVGAGKTTLMKMIEERVFSNLDTPSLIKCENIDNNVFLPRFYYDQPRWALTMQIDFLLDKYNSIKESSNYKYSMIERPMEEFLIFMEHHTTERNMNSDEINLYNTMYDLLTAQIPPADDILIFLNTPVSMAIDRVKTRGREYELDDSLTEYWHKLYQLYMDRFNILAKSYRSIIYIDSSTFDPISRPSHQTKLVDLLNMYLTLDPPPTLRLLE